MTMTSVTEIQINTRNKGSSSSVISVADGGDGKKVTVKVGKEKLWDPLSKLFKKYTHTIDYSKAGDYSGYKPSKYNITVVGPGGSGSSNSNKFNYKAPNEKVHDVEVYFGANDKTNINPLVVGFISRNWSHSYNTLTRNRTKGCPSSSGTGRGSKCYYTWTYLTSTIQGFDGDINEEDAISENDLINGLFHELSRTTGGEKVVIRIGERPHIGSSTYPVSKYFTESEGKGDSSSTKEEEDDEDEDEDGDVSSSGTRQVTVKKDTDYTQVQGFVGYEHNLGGNTVSELYVSYGNDSRHIKVADESGTNFLTSVTVFYETGTGGHGSGNPVLITFSSSEKIYAYSYYDFVKELKGLEGAKTWASDAKTIRVSDAISDGTRSIQTRLEQERERLRPLIAFKKDGGVKNENISKKETKVGPEHKFMKVVMTPNKNDKSGGSSLGPWYVYNNHLFDHESGKKIEGEVLNRTGIFTGDVSSSTSSKYQSITVYYSLKGGDYKALLVEFDPGSSGRKKYFKRGNKEGTSWATENIISANIDEVELTKIGIAAQIIKPVSSVRNGNQGSQGRGGHCGSSSSESTGINTGKPIHIEIETHKKGSYTIEGGGVRVEVTPETPWDKLSKAFKKYTHTIKYPGAGSDYQATKYNITVYGPDGSGFTLYTPDPKVDKLELYFRFIDNVSSKNPLVVGFIYDRSSISCESGIKCKSYKCYYSWSVLKSRGQYDYTITADSISEMDLVIVLLEIGSTVTYRLNKFVIRLDETPGDGEDQSTYPKSGHFKESERKITLKKDSSEDYGFEKYVHTFSSDVGVSECYVTYERNSRYFMTASSARLGSWSWLGNPTQVPSWSDDDKIITVDAYYEKGTTTGLDTRGSGTTSGTATADNNSKKLVLITFTLKSQSTYVYSYSDFINELNQVRSDNIIIEKQLKTIDCSSGCSELQNILHEESNKLKQITFENVSIGGSNMHITEEGPSDLDGGQDNVGPGYKFMKVVMTPNKNDESGGSSLGPWYVYNNHLFDHESGKKIEGEVLNRIATSSSGNKYHSITVYYSPEGGSSSSSIGKYMALLVEFDDYGSKTYIKRLNEQGTKWAFTTADRISISTTGDDKEFLPMLEQQRERLRPLIAFEKDGPGRSRSSNMHITEEGPSDLDGGQDNVGPGYKFMKVVMTPNKNDKSGGSSLGPWRLYNTKLIRHENGAIIPFEVLNRTGIFTGDVSSSTSSKYQSITVYYSLKGGDYKALLVEFDPGSSGRRGCGRRKYIKRVKGGNLASWAIAYGIGINTSSDTIQLVKKLTEIARTADIGVGTASTTTTSIVNSGSSSDSQLQSHLILETQLEETSEISENGISEDISITARNAGIGGGVSFIVTSGGTGFGIYRYRHVFLSLIGK